MHPSQKRKKSAAERPENLVKQSGRWKSSDTGVCFREYCWVKWQPEWCWYPVVSIGYQREPDAVWVDAHGSQPFDGEVIGWQEMVPPAL